jgi:adenosylhomocysteine nucleosidase
MKELFEAVRANDAARIEALVAADPTLAIFAAAMTGDTEKLEALLTGNRSLVNAVSDGWTALHLAAFFGQEAAARALLNKGASTKMRSTNAMNNLPIHAAAAGKHTSIVKLLLEHGTPANAQQHGGWTALHAAAQHGDVDMARVLVANGADVSARADNQQRPLDLAVLKAHQTMVEFLESNGASL